MIGFVSSFLLLLEDIEDSTPSYLRFLNPACTRLKDYLVKEGLLDKKHWFLQYQFGLQIKSLEDDGLLLPHIGQMIPIHALIYTLTRRIAEATVQFCACWLPICLLVVAAYSCKKWLNYLSKDKTARNSQEAKQSFYSLKKLWILLSVFPLSILLPCLAELAFGGILDYQKRMFAEIKLEDYFLMNYQLYLIRNMEPPTFIHLFDFVRLYRSLYGDMKLSPDASIFRQQTELSLSYWSVLAFIGTTYVALALALEALVWRPVKKLFSLLTKDNLTQPFPTEEVDIVEKRTCVFHQTRIRKSPRVTSISNPDSLVSNEDSQASSSTASQKSKKRHSSPSPETGDVSNKECARMEKCRKLPVRPRYISRCNFANLDPE